MATRTEVIALSGRIDRLDRRPAGPGAGRATELAVVDYKTGRHPLTIDDARSSLALALYALAAGRVLRQPCYRVELHQVHAGHGDRLDAHAGVAAAAPVPGRGHRRGVRRGGRELPGRPGRARPGVPAADRAGLRLV